MASTNKTPHLQLNQWTLSDPFLMEDFNSDNAKIDAAIKEIPTVRLADVTTSAAAQTVEIDVSRMELTKYMSLRLYVFSDKGSSDIRLRINKMTDGYKKFYYTNSSWGDFTMVYLSGGMGEADLCATTTCFFNGISACSVPGIRPSQFETFDFSPISGTIPAGTRYVILGVRI